MIAGPVGRLEALLEEPEGGAPRQAALVCHPHPLHGGTMHNKVVYRVSRGLRSTDCEITWLVNGSAREGADYDLAELTWLWDVTTIADKTIIERNQAGVDSRFYVPGPLSPMEDFTRRFLQWYVAIMRGTWPLPAGSRSKGARIPAVGSFARTAGDG